MWRSAGLAGALGIEITLCFVIGGGAGYLLDRKLNTHWIMYVGLFFGLGAAIKGIMRVVKAYKRETAEVVEVVEVVKDDKPTRGQNGGGGAGAN